MNAVRRSGAACLACGVLLLSRPAPAAEQAGGGTLRDEERAAEALAMEEAEVRAREGAGREGGKAGWFSFFSLWGGRGGAPRGIKDLPAPPDPIPAAAPMPAPAPPGGDGEEAAGDLAAALLGEARTLAEKGDPGGARAVLDALLERASGCSDAWEGSGRLRLAGKDYARAGEDYRKAIELDGGNIEAHYGLGTAREKQAEKLEAEGRGAEAQDAYRDAAREYKAVLWRRPDYPPACYSMGCVCARMGKRDDAVYYFRKAIEKSGSGSDLSRRARYNMKLLGEY